MDGAGEGVPSSHIAPPLGAGAVPAPSDGALPSGAPSAPVAATGEPKGDQGSMSGQPAPGAQQEGASGALPPNTATDLIAKSHGGPAPSTPTMTSSGEAAAGTGVSDGPHVDEAPSAALGGAKYGSVSLGGDPREGEGVGAGGGSNPDGGGVTAGGSSGSGHDDVGAGGGSAGAGQGVVEDDDGDSVMGGMFGPDSDDEAGDASTEAPAGGSDAPGAASSTSTRAVPAGGPPQPATATSTPGDGGVSTASAPGGAAAASAAVAVAGSTPSVAAPAAPAVPVKLLPILRGKLAWNESLVCTFSGQWAMTPTDTVTSAFYYVGRSPAPASGAPPACPFDGYFMLKGLLPAKTPGGPVTHTENKVEEKGLQLAFTPAADGAGGVQTVTGNGKNKFGAFSLKGTFDPATGAVEVTKEYVIKPRAAPRSARRGGRTKTPVRPRKAVKREPSTGGRTPKVAKRTAVPQSTPRAQRKRALPSHLRDLGPAYKPQLSEELKACTRVLAQLMRHEASMPFLRPVDPVALNIPDYFDVIKQPMDLGTIEAHVGKGTYGNQHEFANDVRLVFSNAVLYNKPGSDVHRMAQSMQKAFETSFKRAMADVEARRREEAVRREQARSAKQAAEAKRKSAKARAQAERGGARRGRGGRAATPRGRKAWASDDEDDASVTSSMSGRKRAANRTPAARSAKKPRRRTPKAPAGPGAGVGASEVAMLRAQLAALQQQVVALQTNVPAPVAFTDADKRALSESINRLPGDQLDTVLEIIASRMPALRNRAGEEDVEIDIDSLDTGTLVELRDFVQVRVRVV